MSRSPVSAARLAATLLAAGAASAVAVAAALPAQADPGNGQGHGNSHAGGNSQAGSTGHNPPGNNGTVFIHDVSGQHHPYNVPHVGCDFWADFFGFDKNQQVTVTFTGQAPTGKDTKLGGTWGPGVVSTTDAGGAGNDFDKELAFTADQLGVGSLGAPAHQGYHVTMTVATGEPGGKKSKVFWLQPCTSPQSSSVQNAALTGATTSAPNSSDSGVAGTGAAVLGESLTTPLSGATATGLNTSASGATPAAQVLGEHFTRSTAARVLGARLSRATSLPFTGAAGSVTMSLLGLLLTGCGVTATAAARRRRTM